MRIAVQELYEGYRLPSLDFKADMQIASFPCVSLHLINVDGQMKTWQEPSP